MIDDDKYQLCIWGCWVAGVGGIEAIEGGWAALPVVS